MENLIRTRICELRKIMKESGIEIYIIPTGDYHQSEYISDYFKDREYITGFTGSAGTLVVTETEKEDAIIVELKVGPADMGKVIGRQGRIAKAIRTVVKAASSKSSKKVIVDILQ